MLTESLPQARTNGITLHESRQVRRAHERQQAKAAQSLALRDYQVAAIDAVKQADARGLRRVLIVLPTGTGKTVIFAKLIEQVLRRGGRALVLVHRDELARQAEGKIRLVMSDAAIGTVKAERNETLFPIVIASVQTIVRPHRLAELGAFDLVIVDEAHHAAADSYRTILTALGAFESGGPLLVGVTATADRADGRGLDAVFGEIVYERDLLSMIESGFLADLRAKQIRLDVDLHKLHTRAGDFVESEAERALLEANAPEHAVRAYLEHATDRKALVFTSGVNLAHEMAAAFARAGVPSAAVDGAMALDERRDVLGRFARGDVRVVSNCAVLCEGYDEPSLDCVIIARPTRSRSLYTQMIGRGTRLHPGKDDCLIVDLVGATTRHDLMTTASLFGVEPRSLERATVVEAVAREQARRGGVDPDAALVAHTIDLFRQRQLHWVHGRGETFGLVCGVGLVVLRPEAEGWTAVYQSRERREVIAEGLPLDYAQGVAEDYVRRSGSPALVDPRAPWRTKPASDRQRITLRRFRVRVPPELTAGQASDLIAAAIASRCAP